MDNVTTIKISKKTALALNSLKIHPRQPYEEVVFALSSKVRKIKPIDIPDSKKEITTIKLSKKTVLVLNALKIHPRQPYEEVILALIENEKR